MHEVCFRLDAGPQIGFGHFQRTLALAEAFRQEGVACYFLVNLHSMVQPYIRQRHFEYTELNVDVWSSSDASLVCNIISQRRSSMVVVDSDRKAMSYLAQLGDSGAMVCSIEDNAGGPFPCDVVVNGNMHAEEIFYQSVSRTGETLFLQGPHYAILPSEYWSIIPRVRNSRPRVLLITVGGADSRNLTPRLMEVCLATKILSLIVIVGPYFDNQEEINRIALSFPQRIRLVQAPASLLPWIMEADLAISAAGQTLYQLARTGCPVLALSIAENQKHQLDAFVRHGCAIAVGQVAQDRMLEDLDTALRSISSDPGLLSMMKTYGPMLIDGQGALRIVRKVLANYRHFH